MKARSTATKFAWFFLPLAALVALGICSLHRPDPNWYISPPLDAQGHRVQGPIPHGWRLKSTRLPLPTGIPKPGEPVTIVFESQEPMLSRCLRWVRKQPVPRPSHLHVDVGRKLEDIDPKAPADGREVISKTPSPSYLSVRIIKAVQPPIYVVVMFESDDPQTFDSNHASINRFRIE